MRNIIIIIGIIALSMIIPLTAQAEAVGKFSSVEGRVDITSPGQAARPANVGDEVREEDIIRAKSKSKAEILFKDGNILRLAQNTRVGISQYISTEDRTQATIKLFRGKIQNKVKKLLGRLFGRNKDRFEVHTPTSVCGVRGTEFFTYYQKGVSGSIFKEGQGYGYSLNRPDDIREIPTGQVMVVANPDQPPVVRPATEAEMMKIEGETAPSENVEEDGDEGENGGDEGDTAEEKADEGDKESEDDEGSAAEEDDGEAIGEDDGEDGNEMEEEAEMEEDMGMEDSNEGDSEEGDGTVADNSEINESGNIDGEGELAEGGDIDRGIEDGGQGDYAGDNTGPANSGGGVLPEMDIEVDVIDMANTGLTDDLLETTNMSEASSLTSALDDQSISMVLTDNELLKDPELTDILNTAMEEGDLSETSSDSETSSETTSSETSSETTSSETSSETTSSETSSETTSSETSSETTSSETSSETTSSETSSETTEEIPPIGTFEGDALELASGTIYEGKYINPDDTETWTPDDGIHFIEDSSYEYHYFEKDDGTYLHGSTELETYDPTSWTMYRYLPGGVRVRETGDDDDFSHTITEDEWSGSLSELADPPSEDYFPRYIRSYETNALEAIGTFSGSVNGEVTDLWGASESSPLEISLSGEYSIDVTPSLFSMGIKSATSDGGAFAGTIGGYINDINGIIYAVYIDPSNTEAGVLRGEFSGPVDPASNTWEAVGSIYPEVFSTSLGTVTSDTLLTNLERGHMNLKRLTGSFDSSGEVDIKGKGFGRTLSIHGQDWGVFNFIHGADNYYENTSSLSSWAASLKGFGSFGEFQDDALAWKEDNGIWSMDLSSGAWIDNELSGDLSGKFLTLTKMGIIEGEILGSYASSDTWKAVSMGTWATTNGLEFSNSFDGKMFFMRTETAGHHITDSGDSFYFYHYDEYTHEGGSHFYNSLEDTETFIQYQTEHFDGEYADFYYEEWVNDHTNQTFISFDYDGPFSNFDLASLAEAPTDVTLELHDQWTEYNMFPLGHFEGIMGGLENVWGASAEFPAEITFMAEYDMPFYILPDQPIIFFDDIESYNPYNDTFTTPDGGAYAGFMGGVLGGQVKGNIYGMYVDPNDNVGVLIGDYTGLNASDTMVWEATGGLHTFQLYGDIGVTPEELISVTVRDDFQIWGAYLDNEYSYPGYGYFSDESGYSTGDLYMGGGYLLNASIQDEPWGVWQGVLGGFYSGTPSNDWSLSFCDSIMSGGPGSVNVMAQYDMTGTWADNKIDGDVIGAWANLDEALPMIGVSAGKIVGTYDPSATPEMTWQTSTTGVWIRAEQFLEMASTPSGRATLEALNIPAVEIGTASLTGSNYYGTITIDTADVIFFAGSTGGDPRIWATDNIIGYYTAPPIMDDYDSYCVDLNGGSVSASFYLNKWNDGGWGAQVYGYGTLDRTDITDTTELDFEGVAGGGYTGASSGSFSGTGAGLAEVFSHYY